MAATDPVCQASRLWETPRIDLTQQTWVLTGAAGRIASSLRPGLAERVAKLRLVDLDPVEPAHEHEESAVADLRDQGAVEAALAGADGVLHLGTLADEADFHDLAAVNILGTYHVLGAARRTGAERVVFASSNRVTGFYPRTTLVDPDPPGRLLRRQQGRGRGAGTPLLRQVRPPGREPSDRHLPCGSGG